MSWMFMTRQSGKQIARTAKRPIKFIQSTESSVQLRLIDDSEENISFWERTKNSLSYLISIWPDLKLHSPSAGVLVHAKPMCACNSLRTSSSHKEKAKRYIMLATRWRIFDHKFPYPLNLCYAYLHATAIFRYWIECHSIGREWNLLFLCARR